MSEIIELETQIIREGLVKRKPVLFIEKGWEKEFIDALRKARNGEISESDDSWNGIKITQGE